MKTTHTRKTRDGRTAHFRRLAHGDELRDAQGESVFVFIGHFNRPDEPELWMADGSWLESGEEHPNDLVE